MRALAQLLVNPPVGYLPAEAHRSARARTGREAGLQKPVDAADDYDWREMVQTRQFALLWLMYAFAAFAGLMIIGHIAKIAAAQIVGLDLGFLLVAVLAIGNASGRIVAGIVADRIGGVRTMLVVFVMQAAMMGALAFANAPLALVAVAAAVGFCYGANLSLFPSTTAGYFGTAHFGVTYGLVFTAWAWAGGLYAVSMSGPGGWFFLFLTYGLGVSYWVAFALLLDFAVTRAERRLLTWHPRAPAERT